ncbi:hypothetical protein [Peptococcus simiae]|uniref:hypothetical protein n=1 Tax=Peptococcus simiae TaxID=1643805 RepID=UPI0039810E0C
MKESIHLDRVDPEGFPKDGASFKELGEELAVLQRALSASRRSALVIIDGWECVGKGKLLSRLVRDLDPKHYRVALFEAPTSRERAHTFLWRYMRAAPGRGDLVFFDRSQYYEILRALEADRATYEGYLADIRFFERLLVRDGTLVIKFFLHQTRADLAGQVAKRRVQLTAEAGPGAQEELVANALPLAYYEDHLAHYDRVLSATDFDWAPWQVLNTRHQKRAAKAALREITRALKAHLAQPDPADDPLPAGNYPPLDPVKPKAPEDLAPLQKDLGRLLKALHRRQIPVVIVFEGTDTAGKGGTIRRLTRQMDPRGFHVATVAAPSQADLDRHYLGRFYRDFPEKGHLTIFDRSYYGRVLVERVEGLTPTERISQAYDEIVAMEESLVRGQVLVLKFLLVIDKAVQNDRLIDRAKDPDKRYKLTDEDWRNYNKYEAYTEAMAEMVARTDKAVPWQVVDANSKPEARYHILKAVRDALAGALAESEDDCICN